MKCKLNKNIPLKKYILFNQWVALNEIILFQIHVLSQLNIFDSVVYTHLTKFKKNQHTVLFFSVYIQIMNDNNIDLDDVLHCQNMQG